MRTKSKLKKLSLLPFGVLVGAIGMFFLTVIGTSTAQNSSVVKLVMRIGVERTLNDGTRVSLNKGDADFIIVTLTKALSNQTIDSTTPNTSPTNQSFQTRDFLGTWEMYEVPANYQTGSGRFPASLRPALLVKYHNNGFSQSASPEDRRFTSPMNSNDWEYVAAGDTSGVIVLRNLGTIAARLRVRWIDPDTYEDEILYSNEPAYIGIKRVFKRIKS